MKKAVFYSAPLKIDERYWFPYLNAVYSFGISDKKVRKEFTLPTTEVYGYQGIGKVKNKIVLSPCHAGAIAIYDLKQGNMKAVDVGCGGQSAFCHTVEVYQNKVFILPSISQNGILVLDDENKIHRISVNKWGTGEYVRIVKSAIQDRYMWITSCDSNQVLKLDMETENYELIQINVKSKGYTGIAVEEADIWLADVSTGNLIQYNTISSMIEEFKAPEIECNLSRVCAIHNHLFVFDRYILSTPAMSRRMILFDKETEQCQIVKGNFFESTVNDLYPASSFALKIDQQTLWVQRSLDGEIASINVEDLGYTTFSIAFGENDIKEMLKTLYDCENLAYVERSEVSVEELICYIQKTADPRRRRNRVENGKKIWKQLV